MLLGNGHWLGLHALPNTCVNATVHPRCNHTFPTQSAMNATTPTVPTHRTHVWSNKSVCRNQQHIRANEQRGKKIHSGSHRHFPVLHMMRQLNDAHSPGFISHTTDQPTTKHTEKGQATIRLRCNTPRRNFNLQRKRHGTRSPHNASHLSESNARSRAGGHFFMFRNTNMPPNNGAVLTISQIIKAVLSSAAEAESAHYS